MTTGERKAGCVGGGGREGETAAAEGEGLHEARSLRGGEGERGAATSPQPVRRDATVARLQLTPELENAPRVHGNNRVPATAAARARGVTGRDMSTTQTIPSDPFELSNLDFYPTERKHNSGGISRDDMKQCKGTKVSAQLHGSRPVTAQCPCHAFV